EVDKSWRRCEDASRELRGTRTMATPPSTVQAAEQPAAERAVEHARQEAQDRPYGGNGSPSATAVVPRPSTGANGDNGSSNGDNGAPRWSIEDAARLYSIRQWGQGYFSIND